MRISETRKQDLYGAISDAIIDKRILVKNNPNMSPDEIDYHLYKLELDVWERVKKALNIKDE